MKEVLGSFTGEKLGATYFRGSRPIDGIWATDDIEISNACVLPVAFGMGDHRVFCINFSLRSLVGASPIRVVRQNREPEHKNCSCS